MEETNKTQESNNEWKERELGALWKKSGKTQNYFSGKINISKLADEDGFVNIVGFSNKRKSENPNAPDVIIYFSPSVSDGLSLDDDKVVAKENSSNNVNAVESSTTEQTSEPAEVDDETPF